MRKDFDGFMDDWFRWITLWRLILTVPAIEQLVREHESDKQSPRKVLLDSDVMFVCLLLASTGETVSISKVARAIDTEHVEDSQNRERQRITPKILTIADYGLLNLTSGEPPQYSISASEFLISVLRQLYERGNGN